MANNFETWVEGYVAELQDLDTAATDLLRLVTLEAATGVQLDGLGQLIGVERQGLNDDQYRSLLRAYILINISGGTIEQLLQIVRLATNTSIADGAIALYEGNIAEFYIECTSKLPLGTGLIAAEAMYQAKAAGVHAVFEYREAVSYFAFDGFISSKFDGGFVFRGAARNRGARESEIL